MKKPHIDISLEDGLQWEGGGYVHRVCTSDTGMPPSIEADPLSAFAAILGHAKRGDFADIDQLFVVRDAASEIDPRLSYLATLLLGDAGTPRTYARMAAEILADPIDYDRVIDNCHALALRGLLADVPVMLAGYRSKVDVEDADVIPTFISDVLDPYPDRISEGSDRENFGAYEQLVMARYHQLSDHFGADQLLVLKGERFSPRTLVRQLLERTSGAYFDLDLRRRFEAMSGLDCSVAFRDGRLQPLTMAALLERFMAEGAAAVELDENARYFFRHRLPTS